MLQWIVAESEQLKEDGIRFLCRYAEDLGLPYKWSTIMASLEIAIYDKGLMLALDAGGQVRGVLAYTFETKEDGSEDRSRIEVRLLYLEAEFRRGKTLIRAMDALVEREKDLYDTVDEIGFYITPKGGHRRLFGKIATESRTETHPCGLLMFYVTTPDRLGRYVEQHISHSKI